MSPLACAVLAHLCVLRAPLSIPLRPNHANLARAPTPFMDARNQKLPPAPSRINTLSTPAQALAVTAIASTVALLAAFIYDSFDLIRGTSLWNLSRPTWPLLGIVYLAAGIAHFTMEEGFTNITPPNGTWGIFFTPFSPRFNVLWTGVVEVFGATWLLIGALSQLFQIPLPPEMGPALSDGALTLFLITVLVTPANLYALTHGAELVEGMQTPPTAHAIRLAFQSLLLAMFWEMAQPTILDAKVNLGLV